MNVHRECYRERMNSERYSTLQRTTEGVILQEKTVVSSSKNPKDVSKATLSVVNEDANHPRHNWASTRGCALLKKSAYGDFEAKRHVCMFAS